MSYRILVVDDDKSIVKMIKDFLEMEEYSVDTASDGDAALQKAGTQPDLIILDINLPTINGIEVCKKIRVIIPLRRSRLSGKTETICPDRRKPLNLLLCAAKPHVCYCA